MPLPPCAELLPGLSVAGKLDRADIEALADAGVKTIINNRPDDEDHGQFPADEARKLAEARGIAYHHIPFVAATLTKQQVDEFAAVVAGAAKPIVAHCRSGTRSSIVLALTRMRQGANPAALVAEAARHGIDISAVTAIAARLG